MAQTSSPSLPRPARSPEPESGYAKSRETRERILAAALEEAGESGFHRTSVARIAARAAVAIGSLHYHFGSRAELIRELMRQLVADYEARMQAAEAQSSGDYVARERAILLAYLAHVRRHPAYVRLADEIKLHEPELYRRGAARWTKRMAERIREGIAEGALRPMDASEIMLKASFLVGARHSLERLVEDDANLSDEEVVDSYLELVRNGLGVRDEVAARRGRGARRRAKGAAK